jgi:serine/threonine-protein kinase
MLLVRKCPPNKAKPRDAADRLALASFCQQPYQQRYAAAARLYAEAFADQPKLAEEWRLQPRYSAARAGVLAAAGQGRDAAALAAADKARLRSQALAWLRADLTALAALADRDGAGGRAEVARILADWHADPDLAGVRDPAALAKLPAEVRKAWQKLWADSRSLHHRLSLGR